MKHDVSSSVRHGQRSRSNWFRVSLLAAIGAIVWSQASPLSASDVHARRVTVRFAAEGRNPLSAFPMFISTEGWRGKLTGKLGENSVEIEYARVAAIEVLGIKKDTAKLRIKTLAGETFENVVVSKSTTFTTFCRLANGDMQVESPLGAVARIDFGEALTTRMNDMTMGEFDLSPGSVEGRFQWKDGTSLDFVVWDYPEKKYNHVPLGSHGFSLEVGGVRALIPWLAVQSIANADNVAQVRLVSGETLTGKPSEAEIEVWWSGVKAKTRNWSSATFSRKGPVPEPAWMSSCCDGAGGCSGGNLESRFGRWRLTAQDGKSVEGVVTGGFIGNVGDRPDECTLGTYADERILVELMPGEMLRRVGFQWKTNSVAVTALLANGAELKQVFEKDAFERLSLKGYLLWTAIGNHQVRAVSRVRQLASMEWLGNDIPGDWKESVADVPHKDFFWQVETVQGDTLKARSIAGYQRQDVPKPPPPGYYWNVCPPKEDGLAGGGYVVAPHSSGFLLVPLHLARAVDPQARSLAIRSDLAGETFKYVRFHPGDRWVAEGNSGSTYIDCAADAPSDGNCPEMLLLKTATETFAVAVNQVAAIRRTDEEVRDREPNENDANAKPIKGTAAIERQDGSKLRIRFDLSNAQWGFVSSPKFSSASFDKLEQACPLLAAGKTSTSGLAYFNGFVACDVGRGLWRKTALAEMSRLVRKGDSFHASLTAGGEHPLAIVPREIEGESSLGKLSVRIEDVKSVEFQIDSDSK